VTNCSACGRCISRCERSKLDQYRPEIEALLKNGWTQKCESQQRIKKNKAERTAIIDG